MSRKPQPISDQARPQGASNRCRYTRPYRRKTTNQSPPEDWFCRKDWYTGRLKAGRGDTDIFITPGYRFNVADRLITNFHLPKSTLLMLVSAFSGMEHIRSVYRHAVEQEYRFFSYGDAMILGKTE